MNDVFLFVVIQGDSVQTCQSDKTWGGTQPVCAGKTFHNANHANVVRKLMFYY